MLCRKLRRTIASMTIKHAKQIQTRRLLTLRKASPSIFHCRTLTGGLRKTNRNPSSSARIFGLPSSHMQHQRENNTTITKRRILNNLFVIGAKLGTEGGRRGGVKGTSTTVIRRSLSSQSLHFALLLSTHNTTSSRYRLAAQRLQWQGTRVAPMGVSVCWCACVGRCMWACRAWQRAQRDAIITQRETAGIQRETSRTQRETRAPVECQWDVF